jgi:hypothetical protein
MRGPAEVILTLLSVGLPPIERSYCSPVPATLVAKADSGYFERPRLKPLC